VRRKMASWSHSAKMPSRGEGMPSQIEKRGEGEAVGSLFSQYFSILQIRMNLARLLELLSQYIVVCAGAPGRPHPARCRWALSLLAQSRRRAAEA
jgi:hypothetical protein